MRLLTDARLDDKAVPPRNDFFRRYDSKQLTELNITGSMFSQKDVDDLIKFLQIHKYCFKK